MSNITELAEASAAHVPACICALSAVTANGLVTDQLFTQFVPSGLVSQKIVPPDSRIRRHL